MTTKRDHLYPSPSIGRTQGNTLPRTPSHESLTTHPLLSPASTFHEPSHLSNGATSTDPPKYVPYTPRQRVTPSSATTVTTLQPSVAASPQQHQGDATSKLQLVNLKAAAQTIGLDSSSIGWMILERLVFESEHNADWAEIWSAITSGKATLLLPLEQVSTTENCTPDLVKDHVIFYDAFPPPSKSPAITLSGLRGTLESDSLTLRSSIHPSTKQFQSILHPSTRASSFSALPPLPEPLLSSVPNPYPTFSIISHTTSLPLPPRVTPPKPPLPPRPTPRSTSAHTASRLPNPFASLFGAKPASPSTPQTLPQSSNSEDVHIVEVTAFTVDRKIVRKDVGRDITRALRAEIKESLSGLPSLVIERVHDFTSGLYPLVKASKKALTRSNGVPGTSTGSTSLASAYAISNPQPTPDELSQRFQSFYQQLEDDLNSPSLLSKRKEDHPAGDEAMKEDSNNEAKIREIMETVERTICLLFYDRLFMQSSSDDFSHDEALSSRVAALNMLDLGLEHLDVEVGSMGPDLDLVVEACGETLNQLDVACRTPSDKAAVLVAAHKIVVDGLSRLPPIRLKSAPKEKSSVQLSSSEDTAAEATPTIAPQPPSLNTLSTDENKISPKLTPLPLSNPTQPTPVSGDILLPMIIFSVVKANPPHLVSHLLYTQRFRNQAVGGEESYCLINLLAVAEFLENVDLTALGLGDSDKVMSTADLTPLPVMRSPSAPDTPLHRLDEFSENLRGRVGQGVDAIAGSANKVITGVVDSSFTILRSFISTNPDSTSASAEGVSGSAPNPTVRPGFGLLRRQSSGFSIASIAASLPIPGSRQRSAQSEETGQPLVTVSRPGSVRSLSGMGEESPEDASSEDGSDEENGEGRVGSEHAVDGEHDSRSIRSFESMMSRTRKRTTGRKSLSDRLAHVSALSSLRTESPTSTTRPTILPQASGLNRFDTSSSSQPESPVTLRLAPPNKHFLECSEDDIRVSEVRDLLMEYRRIVAAVRAVGGFVDE